MKLTCCWPLIAGLAVATVWLTASSGIAEPTPPVQSAAPGGSNSPASPPAPPLDATPDALANSGPYPGPQSNANSLDVATPPAETREETLAECLSYWDPGTHMSKAEWRETCKRTLNGRFF
jgi:hypothetical protein